MEGTSEIRHEVVGGVAVRWIDAPPPLVATLMFRVGIADERLKTSGITHLTEHLALYPLRNRDHRFNGAVHVDHTAFWASGVEEQISLFFRELCRSLRDLPTDRLEGEARVLAAESQAMTGSHYTDLLRTWFGPNGPGLLGAPEFGLDWLGPTHVGAWSSSYFTAENALLTLTGPPPSGLQFNLPSGGYMPIPELPADVGFRPKSQVKLLSQPAGICLGTVAERSIPLVIAVDIVRQRLRERLRHELGLVYSVQASYEPLSAEQAFVYLATDCDAAHNESVSAAFMEQIRDLAAHGPTAAEMEKAKDAAPSSGEPGDHGVAELGRLAHDELLRHRIITDAEAAAMRAATTAEDVQRAFDEAVACCLVIPAREYDEGLDPRPRRNHETFLGKQYRARRQGGITRLVVADEGVSALAGGRWVSIPYGDLALVTRPAPGIRRLYSRTGGWMELDSSSYWRGDRIIQQLDSLIPPDSLIPILRTG